MIDNLNYILSYGRLFVQTRTQNSLWFILYIYYFCSKYAWTAYAYEYGFRTYSKTFPPRHSAALWFFGHPLKNPLLRHHRSAYVGRAREMSGRRWRMTHVPHGGSRRTLRHWPMGGPETRKRFTYAFFTLFARRSLLSSFLRAYTRTHIHTYTHTHTRIILILGGGGAVNI